MQKRIVTVCAMLLTVAGIVLTSVNAGRAQGVATGKGRVLEALTANLGYEIIRVGPVTVAPNARYQQILNCPAGKKVVGGGVESGSDFSRMISSAPAGSTGWQVMGWNDLKTGTASIIAYAICIVAN